MRRAPRQRRDRRSDDAASGAAPAAVRRGQGVGGSEDQRRAVGAEHAQRCIEADQGVAAAGWSGRVAHRGAVGLGGDAGRRDVVGGAPRRAGLGGAQIAVSGRAHRHQDAMRQLPTQGRHGDGGSALLGGRRDQRVHALAFEARFLLHLAEVGESDGESGG